MTGKNTRNYHQQILEYIKEEGYTLLPNNILTSLVESNAEQFNKLYSLQDKILTALNEFNTSINKLSEVYNINNQNNEMNKRFDTLFNLISKNNMVLERQPQQTNRNINETYLNNIKENITMETENRKRLHYQIYRAQELENCYKNLISQEQPYAPAKFGRKVNENTPTYELSIHRQATMDNINREITLLRERQINWTEEIENMDT